MALRLNLGDPDQTDLDWVSRLTGDSDESTANNPQDILNKAAMLIDEYSQELDAGFKLDIARDFYDVLGLGDSVQSRTSLPNPRLFVKSARAQVLLGIDPHETFLRSNYAPNITPEQWYDSFATILSLLAITQ